MIRLRQLGPAFIRHLESYGRLAAAAAKDARDIGRRRIMLAVIGLVLSIALVTLAGGTLIAAGWGTAWRWWIAAGVLASLAIATFACLSHAFSAMPRSTHMQALEDEWRKDKAWLSARGREPPPAPAGAGERVDQGRRGLPDTRAPSLHDA